MFCVQKIPQTFIWKSFSLIDLRGKSFITAGDLEKFLLKVQEFNQNQGKGPDSFIFTAQE